VTTGSMRPATRMAHSGTARSHAPERSSLITIGWRQRHGQSQPRTQGRPRIRSRRPAGPGQRLATRLGPGRHDYGPGGKAYGRYGHSSSTCRAGGPATVGKNRAPGKVPRATTPVTRVHKQLEVTLGPGGHGPGESAAEAAGTTRPATDDRLRQAALRRGATAEPTLGAAAGAALQTEPQPPARRVHWHHHHWGTSRIRHSTPAAQAQPAAGRRAPAETGAKIHPELGLQGPTRPQRRTVHFSPVTFRARSRTVPP
jgi:hypothetical protein